VERPLTFPPATAQRPELVFAGICCLLFVSLGLLVLPYPGIQNDEALFAAPLYHPYIWYAKIAIFHHNFPTMLTSYLGTLKTWIYFVLFRIWTPSVLSIRLPVLLTGAATIWLSFLLMCRLSGGRSALAAAAFLATDVTFLFTTCFDWGPVALQHLLLVSSVLLLVKFHQDGGKRTLGLGFFLFGLGLWDKALFLWPLAGLGVATLVVYPRELVQYLRLRIAVPALICLAAGAFPLLVYNLKSRGNTIAANAVFAPDAIAPKFAELRNTLNGSALLGYMTGEDWMEHPRLPKTAIERFSFWVHEKSGDHRAGLNWPSFLLALLLVPWLWRTPARRPLLFVLLFLAVTWFQMALTADAGLGVHHIALLWPFPCFFIATAFAEASRPLKRFGKLALALTVAIIAGQNLLVYNQHLEQLIRDGGHGSWTDAIFPLSDRLHRYNTSKIYIIDWGMFNSLRLLNQGGLDLKETWDLLNRSEPDQAGLKTILSEISNPDHVFVGHTAELEEFKGVSDHLSRSARSAGYEPVHLETVCDGNGRPVFEIFRFRELGRRVIPYAVHDHRAISR
jgi:4-amino-4-deoxy-L-arabinose transferase-like glycosyltransferase